MSILNRITELRDAGLTDAKVRATLTLEDYSAKDITQAFKDLGGAKKAKGFAAEFYDWLAECPRSKVAANLYVMGEGGYDETTKNVQKHLSHYMNIWELSTTIWGKSGAEPEADPEPEVEAEAEDNSAEYQKAWDKAMNAKEKYEHGGSKPRRNTYHPDKVAKFQDKAITDLYTELFKMFT